MRNRWRCENALCFWRIYDHVKVTEQYLCLSIGMRDYNRDAQPPMIRAWLSSRVVCWVSDVIMKCCRLYKVHAQWIKLKLLDVHWSLKAAILPTPSFCRLPHASNQFFPFFCARTKQTPRLLANSSLALHCKKEKTRKIKFCALEPCRCHRGTIILKSPMWPSLWHFERTHTQHTCDRFTLLRPRPQSPKPVKYIENVGPGESSGGVAAATINVACDAMMVCGDD